MGDRVILDKLVDSLKWGIPYGEVADATCSATTARRRRNEWIQVGIVEGLEHLCVMVVDKMPDARPRTGQHHPMRGASSKQPPERRPGDRCR